MAKRKRTNAPSYTEAQTKAWLTWLARGMQRHGQTLFMIAQLQPSWLSTRLGRCTYILSSRLIVGLIFGVIFELIYERTTGIRKGLFHRTIVGPCFGLYVGLIVGFMDAVRLNRSVNRSNEEDAPTSAQLAISALNTNIGGGWGCLGCFGCLGVIALIALLFFLPERSEQIDQIAGQIVVLAFAMLCSGLAFVFLWRIRGTQRVLTRDIQPVETLRWSWKHAAKDGKEGFRLGCFIGRRVFVGFVGIGAVLGVLTIPDVTNRSPDGFIRVLWLVGGAVGVVVVGTCLGLSIGLVVGLFLGVFGGLRPGIQEMKTTPNQGMMQTLRSAFIAGFVFGVFFAVPFGLVCGMIGGSHLALEGALVTGMVFGLFTGLWYGGLDVVQHYVLRLILFMGGLTPLNYVRFLDYAANELNFLQKVGGGYIFIHRILLEHFADMENEEESNPQDTPMLAAPASSESVSIR